MQSGQTSKPAEVGHIQREDVSYAMNVHDRRQARIVYLNARDTVLNDDFAPLGIYGRVIG